MGPEAFRGAMSILASAVFYAWNIILMRQQALVAKPVEVAFFTGADRRALLSGRSRPSSPSSRRREEYPSIVAAAVLGFGSLMLLSWAYARAEAQYLAPVEYTAFIWAACSASSSSPSRCGRLTLVGAAMIVAACFIAARRTAGRRSPTWRRRSDGGGRRPCTAWVAGGARPLAALRRRQDAGRRLRSISTAPIFAVMLERRLRIKSDGQAYAVWGGIGASGRCWSAWSGSASRSTRSAAAPSDVLHRRPS